MTWRKIFLYLFSFGRLHGDFGQWRKISEVKSCQERENEKKNEFWSERQRADVHVHHIKACATQNMKSTKKGNKKTRRKLVLKVKKIRHFVVCFLFLFFFRCVCVCCGGRIRYSPEERFLTFWIYNRIASHNFLSISISIHIIFLHVPLARKSAPVLSVHCARLNSNEIVLLSH